jgi:glycosyltransferase involved in cell wall biosynthesis
MSAYAGARGRRISRVSPIPPGGKDAARVRRAFRVSVVIPAKNEEGNIAWVLRHMPLSVDEVILVDGNSTDHTVEVARAIRPDIVVVNEPGRGKGTAMRAGFAAARGAYVVVLDADGSMDPADVDRFVDALEAGADLVKGSRYIAGGASSDLTFIRSLGNRLLLFASNLIYGQRFTELCYGFMALRRSRIDELRLIATGFEIETEIVCRSVVQGFRITELPSLEAERISGESNLHAVRDGLRVVRTMLRCAVSETVAPATEPAPAAHLANAFERFEELVAESQRVPVKAEVSIVD